MLLRKLLLTRGFGSNTPSPPGEDPGDPDVTWSYENIWCAQIKRPSGSGVPRDAQVNNTYFDIGNADGGSEDDGATDWRFLVGSDSKFSIVMVFSSGTTTASYSQRQYLLDCHGDSGEIGFGIYLGNPRIDDDDYIVGAEGQAQSLCFEVGTESSSVTIQTDPDVQTIANQFGIGDTSDWQKWHVAICTFDSSLASNNMKIYLDGAFHAQGTYTNALNVTKNGRIGALRRANQTETWSNLITSIEDVGDGTAKMVTTSPVGVFHAEDFTISGVNAHWNGTYTKTDTGVGSTNLYFSRADTGGANDYSNSGGGTIRSATLMGALSLNLDDIHIWSGADGVLATMDSTLINYFYRQPHLGSTLDWNMWNQGITPVLDDYKNLFAWWTFGDGLEQVNGVPDFEGTVKPVYNMSSATGHGPARSVQNRDLFTGPVSNINYPKEANRDITATMDGT